jgi:hypothetical protein
MCVMGFGVLGFEPAPIRSNRSVSSQRRQESLVFNSRETREIGVFDSIQDRQVARVWCV